MIPIRLPFYALTILLVASSSLAQPTFDAGPYKCPAETLTVSGSSDGEISAQYQVPLNGKACTEALKLRRNRQRLNLWNECMAVQDSTKKDLGEIPGCEDFDDP